MGDRDRAIKEYEELEKLQKLFPFPEYGIPCLNRPKIHVFLESGNLQDRQAGFELIVSKYLSLYRQDRHCYYRDVLRKWKKRFPELDLDIPESEYGAVILTYLPRNNVDAG